MSGKHDPLGASAAEMMECGWNGGEEIRQSWNRFWEEIPGSQRSIRYRRGFVWCYAAVRGRVAEWRPATRLIFAGKQRDSRREMIASGHAKRYTER